MKVWSYDIWDGDKGIIFAETKEEAIALYESNYDELIVDGDYDSGLCQMEYVCDVPDYPKLYIMYN